MSTQIVLCTCPDETTAERIAKALVEERLAACVNRLSDVVSVYRWKDQVQRDHEQLLIIKTTRACFDLLRDRIVALHPHELPEIIAVDIATGLDRYLDWIESETRSVRI